MSASFDIKPSDVTRANKNFSGEKSDNKISLGDIIIGILIVVLFIGLVWVLIKWWRNEDEEIIAEDSEGHKKKISLIITEEEARRAIYRYQNSEV